MSFFTVPTKLSPIFWLFLSITMIGALSGKEHQHPYLFFSAEDVPVFRERIASNEWAAKAFERIKEAVDKVEGIELPPPNSLIREEWRPIVQKYPRIGTYAAFLYVLTKEERYLDLAREYLITFADGFEERINFHNIDQKDGIVIYDTGELGIYSAWAYDMIYDQLSDAERTKVEEKLLKAIVETIRETVNGPSMQDLWAGIEETGNRPRDYDWGPGQWNGTMYCNTGIAAIGFALQDETIYEHAINNWKVYLERDMLADGMWQEEDFAYSRFCYSSMQTLAEMAYQYGYRENLYTWEVEARDYSEWDAGYVDAPLTAPERKDAGKRNMKMFLDAQIDWQYPNLGPGNWGWQTNRASFLKKREHVTFYELGYLRYDDPVYGWVVNQLDRSLGNGYAQSYISPIMYADPLPETGKKPATASRWYDHSKWLVLKSIEGEAYWGSDSLYAFMPYGGSRTKSLRPLSVDLFAFGKVVAPRVAKRSRHQAHDKDYYLTDDSWNAYLVDGQNVSNIKEQIVKSYVRFHDFNPDLKIAQAAIQLERSVRASIWYPDVVERRPEMDRLDSRLLAMSGDYVLDILDIRYEEPQAFKRHFEWVWHAFGDLTLQGVQDEGEVIQSDWSATWLDSEDNIGIKTTMLGSAPRKGSTKVTIRENSYGSYVKVLRGNDRESFIAVHEPFQDTPKIDEIKRLSEGDGTVALKITEEGKFRDYLCMAFAADQVGFEQDGEMMEVEGNYGYIRVSNDSIIARGDIKSFRIYAPDVQSVMINGKSATLNSKDGYVTFDR